jgi:hypothetical protein
LRGSAADELNWLVRLGMLHEDRPDDTRRVYYERTTSPSGRSSRPQPKQSNLGDDR